jgi:hypothetical protein
LRDLIAAADEGGLDPERLRHAEYLREKRDHIPQWIELCGGDVSKIGSAAARQGVG